MAPLLKKGLPESVNTSVCRPLAADTTYDLMMIYSLQNCVDDMLFMTHLHIYIYIHYTNHVFSQCILHLHLTCSRK